MDEPLIRKAIAVGLVAYAIYLALHLAALLLDSRAVLLSIVFLVETLAALLAAVAVWRNASWMATAVVIVGVAFVCRQLVEGPVLGLFAYLPAIGLAILGLLAALGVAAYLRSGTSRSLLRS
jgi:hypothetical protein